MNENKLGKIDVFSVALGSIIGWGAFMLPGTKFLKESGIINTTIGILLGALAMIIIQVSYSKMLSEHNDSGGEFSYIYRELGEKHGFINGWFLSLAYLSIIPLNATAFPLVIDKLLDNRLKFGLLYEIAGYKVFLGEVIISSIIIILFAFFNIRGLKKTVVIQKIITIFLMGFVFIISICMFIKVDSKSLISNYIINNRISISQIFRVFAISPWLYIGFDSVVQLTQNFNFESKKVTSITVASIIFSAIIYNLLNIITGFVYAPNKLEGVDWATGAAVMNNLGYLPFLLLVISLISAVWGGVNGFMISTNKLMSSMAEYRVLPNVFLKTNKYGENKNIIIFISSISLILPWFGRVALNWIVDMSSIGAAIAYAYVCYIMVRNSMNLKEKILGKIGLGISLFFIALLLIPQSPAFLSKESIIMLVIWVILGGVYYILKERKVE